jgi:hypothetical protein
MYGQRPRYTISTGAPDRFINIGNRASALSGRFEQPGTPTGKKHPTASRTHNVRRRQFAAVCVPHWRLATVRVKYRAFQGA